MRPRVVLCPLCVGPSSTVATTEGGVEGPPTEVRQRAGVGTKGETEEATSTSDIWWRRPMAVEESTIRWVAWTTGRAGRHPDSCAQDWAHSRVVTVRRLQLRRYRRASGWGAPSPTRTDTPRGRRRLPDDLPNRRCLQPPSLSQESLYFETTDFYETRNRVRTMYL